ncbi:hypothetical protein CG434_23315 [Pantoea ananatis]|nr:hypothetical protein [Pantoea ananatis]NQE83156.1 hypothetical protein [Pantoea ananatis]PQK82676.1 hypothetical protein CG432_22990 [Pantoea ananatis]PQK86328.1 hypothetical protein CG433_22680 [Pantoea ananatis]PQK93864.1 hypothetical protein CG434_23315 [Pantoea ananatis]
MVFVFNVIKHCFLFSPWLCYFLQAESERLDLTGIMNSKNATVEYTLFDDGGNNSRFVKAGKLL